MRMPVLLAIACASPVHVVAGSPRTNFILMMSDDTGSYPAAALLISQREYPPSLVILQGNTLLPF